MHIDHEPMEIPEETEDIVNLKNLVYHLYESAKGKIFNLNFNSKMLH